MTVALAVAIFIVVSAGLPVAVLHSIFSRCEGPMFLPTLILCRKARKHVADHLAKVEQALWDTNDLSEVVWW
ncbi:MAG: hypothetical protein CM1200mP18_10800 [Gammaproteobacteria bacterium]|nr:MAG: hypothetical protein CM1200mP18_10800 [Gammaproteobacteria bacterium]